MKLTIPNAIEILERTPQVLDSMLRNLSDDWNRCNEGENTWSAYDIVGHLIHGDKTDWIQRLEIILANSSEKNFQPFDRFAQFEESKGKTMNDLLDEFSRVRKMNTSRLISKNITASDFNKTGIHPSFGEVTLSQLLSTWVAHDLGHIAQINRVMARQYTNEVGPWKVYLRILN